MTSTIVLVTLAIVGIRNLILSIDVKLNYLPTLFSVIFFNSFFSIFFIRIAKVLFASFGDLLKAVLIYFLFAEC